MTKILNIKDSSGNYLKLANSNIPFTLEERIGTTSTGSITLTNIDINSIIFLKWGELGGSQGGVAIIQVAWNTNLVSQYSHNGGSVSIDGYYDKGVIINFSTNNVYYSALVY